MVDLFDFKYNNLTDYFEVNQPDAADGIFQRTNGLISHVHMGKIAQKIFGERTHISKEIRLTFLSVVFKTGESDFLPAE